MRKVPACRTVWHSGQFEESPLAGSWPCSPCFLPSSEIFAGAVERGLISRAPQVTAITSADYPTPARRPAWSVLDNSGFARRFGYALSDWQPGLHDVLDALARQRA